MNQTIVAHYHLFKNAGTSVDDILKRNFGKTFLKVEFDSRGCDMNATEVRHFIEQNPSMSAFASHTALIQRIDVPDVFILPLVFVRHPLVRLRSAYLFERKQRADTFGAVLAKETDFAGYIETRLGNENDRSCRDFQTYRLSHYTRPTAGDGRSELDRALAALTDLEFVGVVERFDESMNAFTDVAARHGIALRPMAVRSNVTEGNTAAPEEVEAVIRAELGADLYDTVVEANQAAYAVHRAAKTKLDSVASLVDADSADRGDG